MQKEAGGVSFTRDSQLELLYPRSIKQIVPNTCGLRSNSRRIPHIINVYSP